MATPGSLLLKLIIDGTSAGAVKALAQAREAGKATSEVLAGLGKRSGGFGGLSAEIDAITGKLKGLQGVGAMALQFLGVGLGVNELIQLGDAYTQMTSKLKLVTQYSGDYVQVQAMLRESAQKTRSDLAGTVDLYAQISPALKGIGLSAAQSVGVITTINQAIGLSGASSEAAKASLVQLGQGFASGALRGEELNSVMEQTPALAQAIADGLGVSRGALRKMGEDGKLTAEAVATALQKVADQVNGDFSKAPVTVGQSLIALKNEILVYVGAADQAYGATSSLAQVVLGVAEEFRTGGPAVTAFSTAVSVMVNGLDGAYRMLKIVGLGLAGYAAAAKAALSGNFSEAKAIWQELGRDIDAVLMKPLIGQQKAVDATVDGTRKRIQLETQLADEVKRLEALKAYVAGTTQDNVAAKDKANIDARIADQQRLVDAVRTAWQQQLGEAEKFALAAQAKLQKATEFRDAGSSAAFNAGIKGMSAEEQAAAKSSRMSDLQGQGAYEAARARLAALEGDIKKYDVAAAQAERRLKEALQLAQDIGDIASIEDISNQLAKNQEVGAALDKRKADEAAARATDQAKLLNDLQAKLDEMTKQARMIEVKADITDAESKVKGLNAQLAEIKDKTVTVTVNTVAGNNAEQPKYQDSYGPWDTGIPGRAYGGPLPGWAPNDRADNMIYRGTPGEWVMQLPAVRYYGPDFMAKINAMRLPKYAFGGQIGGNSVANRFSVPNMARNPATAAGRPVVLDMGKMGRFETTARADVADELVRVVKRAALGYGRR